MTNTQPNKTDDSKDEKLADLIAEIEQFQADGNIELAVEASLQLANEHALRGNRHRAYATYRQVLRKAKRPGRTILRINALIDFGKFMAGLEKFDDAVHVLKFAAGVAKKSKDKERFAQALAALGIVSLHSGDAKSAKRYLKKAQSMLEPWDAEADIVAEHLQAIDEGKPCNCSSASDASSDVCLLYTSPSPRDATLSRMPSSA